MLGLGSPSPPPINQPSGEHYMSQMLYAGQSDRENVPFLSDF